MKTLLVALALALAAQDSKPIHVKTKAGKEASVQVLGLEGTKAHLKVFAMGGEVTLKRDLSEFTPESAFLIEMRATNPTTFEQHFGLAKKAAEMGLLPQAGGQARAAAKAAGEGPAGDAKELELRSWAAGALEKFIAVAIAAGDVETARDGLTILTTRLADQRTDEQLAKISASVEMLSQSVATKHASDRAAKRDAARRADLDKKLETIRATAEKGDKALAGAYSDARKTAQAVKSVEQAIDHYKSAFNKAKELAEANPNDSELATEVAALCDQMADSAIRGALHAASLLTTQSDYNGATEWCNRILKFDPENAEATAMLQTIQIASAEAGSRDWRYGWRRRR
jgi:hypothetical protein